MRLQQLLKQSINIVIENQVIDDLVWENDSVEDISDRIRESNAADLLIVYLGEDKKIKTVLTHEQIGPFIKLLENSQAFKNKKPLKDIELKELELENLSQDNIIKIPRDKKIGDVYELFKEKDTNILIVQDKSGGYAGKIKKNNFVATIRNLQMVE